MNTIMNITPNKKTNPEEKLLKIFPRLLKNTKILKKMEKIPREKALENQHFSYADRFIRKQIEYKFQ